MAFFFCNVLSLHLWASASTLIHEKQSLSNSKDSLKNILNRAQELTLSKKRGVALQVLLDYSTKDLRKGAAPDPELKETFGRIANSFMQESSQQNFELALSQMKSGPLQGIQKIKEVLQVEPDHLGAQLALARLQMIRKECSRAEEIIEKIKVFSSLSEDIQLAIAQNVRCNHFNKSNLWPEILDLSEESLKIYSYEMQFEKSVSLGPIGIEKAKTLLNKMKKLDSNYPENIRLESELTSLKSARSTLLAKYENRCRNLSVSDVRKYYQNPYLCFGVSVSEK